MFCPKCGAENESGPAYCRRCGLPLAPVRLASEGRVGEALAGLGKGSGRLSGGALVLALGLLNALVNGYFDAWQSAVVSALAGSAVGVPLIASGAARLRRAKQLLSPQDDPKPLGGGAAAAPPLPAAGRDSVTEHTTLKLEPRRPPGLE
jgi:hypothetical protein